MPAIPRRLQSGEDAKTRRSSRAFFRDFGVKQFILKMGSNGCFAADYQGHTVTMEAYTDMPVIDSTGAGDSFVAAYLCGVMKGLSVKECCLLGNVNGALNIGAVGATQGSGTLETIKQFIRAHGAKTLDADALLSKL